MEKRMLLCWTCVSIEVNGGKGQPITNATSLLTFLTPNPSNMAILTNCPYCSHQLVQNDFIIRKGIKSAVKRSVC
jgi:hypothetical protein